MFSTIQKSFVTLSRLLPLVALLCVASQPEAKASVRFLSGEDMAAVTGDAPGPAWCKKKFKCNIGIFEGQNCVYCDSTELERYRCCTADPGEKTCDYTGGPACSAADRWVSDGGTAASCTCTASDYTKTGKCYQIKDADCKKTCDP